MEQSPKSLYSQQLQAFLDAGEKVRVFLTTGVGLVGKLVKFDEESLLLADDSSTMPMLVLRNNVLSVSAARDLAQIRGKR